MSDWRQDVDHQAVRDAVLFWWEHRRDPRVLPPAARVGFVPFVAGPAGLTGRIGHVMQVLPSERRLVQFGGEEDGSAVVRIVATLDELLPL